MQYGCRLSAGFWDNRAEADGSVRFRQEAGYDLMILLMMRSYFCIDLKGKSLFLPFLAAWAAAVGGTLLFLRFAERYASPEPLLDWSFAAFAVCCLLFVVVMQAACCFALYFFVRATAGGMALSGERFEADYPPRRYAALCTKGILLGTVTLGVYLPWFIRDVVRYFAEGLRSVSMRWSSVEALRPCSVMRCFFAWLRLLSCTRWCRS